MAKRCRPETEITTNIHQEGSASRETQEMRQVPLERDINMAFLVEIANQEWDLAKLILPSRGTCLIRVVCM